jgi:hypothetical protein
MYNVIHIFFNIFTFSFFWTPEGGRGHLNPKKVHHCTGGMQIFKFGTMQRRSDSKKAYRSQAFFSKLSLTAMMNE